jgi:hypothetical protein
MLCAVTRLALVLGLVLPALAGCSLSVDPHDATPPYDLPADYFAEPPPPDGGCSLEGLTYTSDIDPIVARVCTGCHTVTAPELVKTDPMANLAALGGTSALEARGFLYSDRHPVEAIAADGCEDQQIRAWLETVDR